MSNLFKVSAAFKKLYPQSRLNALALVERDLLTWLPYKMPDVVDWLPEVNHDQRLLDQMNGKLCGTVTARYRIWSELSVKKPKYYGTMTIKSIDYNTGTITLKDDQHYTDQDMLDQMNGIVVDR